MPVRTVAGTGDPPVCPTPAAAVAERPLRAFLDLGVVLTAPGCARAWTREILWEWGAAGLADSAELVASELVTNSVNACAGLDRAVIRLVLTLTNGELAILVRDDHPATPMAARPATDDESGRGLLIVETLSDRCGWYPLKGSRPVKVTWAVIARPGRHGNKKPGIRGSCGVPDADPAERTRLSSLLPTRLHPTPLAAGMSTPRLVDLEILARVKVALERL